MAQLLLEDLAAQMREAAAVGGLVLGDEPGDGTRYFADGCPNGCPTDCAPGCAGGCIPGGI
jgi:hypothetical protein